MLTRCIPLLLLTVLDTSAATFLSLLVVLRSWRGIWLIWLYEIHVLGLFYRLHLGWVDEIVFIIDFLRLELPLAFLTLVALSCRSRPSFICRRILASLSFLTL